MPKASLSVKPPCQPSSLSSTASSTNAPPPSPSRLAKVLRPITIVPSPRSSSLSATTPTASAAPMGAAVSQHAAPPLPAPVPSTTGRLRSIFGGKKKKDEQANALARASTPPSPGPAGAKQRSVTAPLASAPAARATASVGTQGSHSSSSLQGRRGAHGTTLQLPTSTTLAGERVNDAAPTPLPKSPRMMPQPQPAPRASHDVPESAHTHTPPTSTPAQAEVSAPVPVNDSSMSPTPPAQDDAATTAATVSDCSSQPPPTPPPTRSSADASPPCGALGVTDASASVPASTPAPSTDCLQEPDSADTKDDGAAAEQATTTPSSSSTAVPATPAPAPVRGSSTERAERESPPPARSRPRAADKDDWRKSDATTSSHTTVRPRNSAQRPVSMADSLQSTSTVVGGGKRLSALLTDAEFVLAEAPSDDDIRPRKRHSISLHFTSPSPPSLQPPAAAGNIRATASSQSAPVNQMGGRSAWAPPPPGPARWAPQLSQAPAQQPHASPSGMFGFGKRAVERMGRALGGLSSHSHVSGSHTNHLASSGYTSSSSSNVSVPDEWRGRPRRTPNAPSGTWSIQTGSTSGTGTSDDGPSLGDRVRGPLASRGLVFGKPLEVCVQRTALEPIRVRLDEAAKEDRVLDDPGVDVPLEERLLPALVVRCVQHIMRWGLEEEGLFRISGRASHIAKLRVEFDTGADYDMRECPPGDLDPHAVSSVFKAYLRELPEPILTKQLNPLFEAAMAAENEARASLDEPSVESAPAQTGIRRPALPSNPRDARLLHKAPSLTTLAMPNFSGMRPPSAHVLATFTALIARLPRAHRDLLRTVTELIRATALRKETRMPLSNLTVVFCPSLSMSPPILRVLCESEEIWQGSPSLDPAIMAPLPPASDSSESYVEVEDEERDDTDDVASYASSADQPWPALSSPSSSSLATPNDDRASDSLACDTDADDSENPHSVNRKPIGPLVDPAVYSPDASPNPNMSPLINKALLQTAAAVTLLDSSQDVSQPSIHSLQAFGTPSSTSSRRSSMSLRSASDLARGKLTISGPLTPPVPLPVAQSLPALPEPPLSPPPVPIPRPKRPSITALFSKRSLSSLRSSRLYLGNRSGSNSPGLQSPQTPRSPEGSMVTAPETITRSASDGSTDLRTEDSQPPTVGLNIRTSPFVVPAVLRADDDVEDAKLTVSKRASRSSPNLTSPSLPPPTKPAGPRPITQSISRGPSSPANVVVSAASPVANRSVPPELDLFAPVKDSPALSPSPPNTATLAPSSADLTPTPPGSAQKTPSQRGLTPVLDLPAPYNRLSLWEDGGCDVVDGEWASRVLLAADAGWLTNPQD